MNIFKKKIINTDVSSHVVKPFIILPLTLIEYFHFFMFIEISLKGKGNWEVWFPAFVSKSTFERKKVFSEKEKKKVN